MVAVCARASLLRTTVLAAAASAALGGCTIDRGGKAGAPLELSRPASAEPWKRYGDWPRADWSAFDTLRTNAAPAPSKPPPIALPVQGDAERGMKLAFDRGRGGGCVACHVMGPRTPTLPGNVGPDLSEIGAQRTDDWLLAYVWDPRVLNPVTVMPPWGTHSLYSADEVRDIVAFLKTLKTAYRFKDASEDPARRKKEPDERDNLDPIVNPAMFERDKGETLFARAGPKGSSCSTCHAQPKTQFRAWAASMPRWEPRLNKVLGIEEFVTRHARATTGAEWPMQSDENFAVAIYLKFLANGTPINVDVNSPGASEANERGRQLMARKIGQLNFACLDCHAPDRGANKWIRGQWLTEQNGQVGHHPYYRTSRGEIWDLRKRMQWCGVAIRANELPPDAPEYGDLELALTAVNNGNKLDVPGIGH